jgi:hypothetical protein
MQNSPLKIKIRGINDSSYMDLINSPSCKSAASVRSPYPDDLLESRKNLASDRASISSSESYDDMCTEYEMSYKNLIPNCKILKKNPYWTSFALKKKFKWYKKILIKLKDPLKGAGFKDIKKLFDVFPECTTGSNIFSSFQSHYPHLGEVESLRILQNMVDYGYIIPVEKERVSFFNDSSLYTYQIFLMLHPTVWELSDEDYLNFLNRNQTFFGGETEITERITALMKIVPNPVSIVNQQYKIQEYS